MKYPSILLAFAAAVLVPAGARAAEVAAPKGSLIRVVEDGNAAFTAFVAGPTAASSPSLRADTPSRTAPADAPFMDLVPRASLLVRDWRGSLRLAGAATNVVDDLRPSASNRLVIARVATGSRLSTFAQLGAGQWRIDPVLFPAFPTYDATCGQLGAGFQLAVTSRVRLAGEIEYTVLYGTQPWSGDVAMPRLVSSILALEAGF